MALFANKTQVIAFQRAHGLSADGIEGLDTVSRWRADHDPGLDHHLRRGFSRIGVIDRYSMDYTQQSCTCTDCSGFVCMVLGITKAPGGPDAIDWWLNTDGILRDANGVAHCFARVTLAELAEGDLVCYGRHAGGVGHIAFVVDPVAQVILDCSGTRNGVHCHKDDHAHFWRAISKRPVYGLRYVGPEL